MDHLNTLVFLNYSVQEDYYWSELIPKAFKDYKVAGIEDAIKFSFEVNPALLYKMNKHQLPFGCHAWEKYDPVFWKDYINTENILQR